VERQAVDKALVERIIATKRAEGGTGIRACASAASQTRMSVAQWEREIDERVYRLYGLTPAEIKIVEEGGQKG
jgi:hypothetical protein